MHRPASHVGRIGDRTARSRRRYRLAAAFGIQNLRATERRVIGPAALRSVFAYPLVVLITMLKWNTLTHFALRLENVTLSR